MSRSSTIVRTLSLCAAGVLGLTQAADAQTVSWAGVVGRAESVAAPSNFLGAPDGTMISPPGMIRVGRFGPAVAYADLATFLNVPASILDRADVIAFEGNGGSPAPSGGWESSRWVFSDGAGSVSVDFVETIGAPVPPEVIANGTVSEAAYRAYFGASAATGIFSYIIFDLPTLDLHSRLFTVSLTAGVLAGLPGEGTPDPDAVGVFAALPCPADFNADGTVNSQDFFDFLVAFFGAAPAADFNLDGVVNSQDFFDFLTEFFGGCA